MADDTVRLQKSISGAFVLDPPKFTRIVNILDSAGADPIFAPSPAAPKFTIKLRDRKELNLTSPQNVLVLDNPLKNPIRSLMISIGPGVGVYAPSATVRFEDDRSGKNIHVSVTHKDHKFATELFAKLEEQVQRAVVTSWAYSVRRVEWIFLVFLLGCVIAGIGALFGTPPPATLSAEQVTSLNARLAGATTDAEKLAALVEVQRAQIALLSPSKPTPSKPTSPRAYVLLGLVLVLLSSAFYLVVACYPYALFVWGDQEERHTKIQSKRRFVYMGVLATLALGILASAAANNLFPGK